MSITQAELWDKRIERAEWLTVTSEELPEVVNGEKALDLLVQVRGAAAAAASGGIEQLSADRALTFGDGSRLLLIALDAGTAACQSRVLQPGEPPLRNLRDGSPYRHGITTQSWLAFPPTDAF